MLYLLLLALFGVVMGVSILNNFQKKYVERPVIVSVYFLIASVMVLYLFPQTFNSISLEVLLGIGPAYAVAIIVYMFARRYLRCPEEFIATHGEQNVFVRLSYPFLAAKGFEILFQQLCFASFVLLLAAAGMSLTLITMLSVGVLVAAHLPLIATHGIRWGSGYAAGTLLLSAVLPYLVLQVPFGLAISFALHFLAYVLGGVAVWVYQGRKV